MTSTAETDEELLSQIGATGSRTLLLAALEAFSTSGYHGATTRQIADLAGMSPAAVYVHYAAKSDLLYTITVAGHRAAIADAQRALKGATGPAERLAGFVRAFAAWHARHHTLARVTQYELRALDGERLAEIRRLRQRVTALVERELKAGRHAGVFDVADVRGTALAAISLCIDVARWYHPGHRQSPGEVGELYAELVLRMVATR
jgi:AcrR family transcriptional regulator